MLLSGEAFCQLTHLDVLGQKVFSVTFLEPLGYTLELPVFMLVLSEDRQLFVQHIDFLVVLAYCLFIDQSA